MDKLLEVVIFGIATGALYAIIASGLVVTYTTSGIFNFAHGAVGMLSAFVFWQLADDGAGWGLPPLLAAVLVVGVFAPALGALLDRAVMRRLEGASIVTTLVVTIGLMVGIRELIVSILWPANTVRNPISFFEDTTPLDILGARISYDRFLVLVMALVVAVGLRALLFRTRAGMAMRATVDDRQLLQLNGARPDRSSTISWALGSSLAALAAILVAPVLGTPLDFDILLIIVINGYAAAVFGRLRSVPLTFVGAMVIGLAQSVAVQYLDDVARWFPDDIADYILINIVPNIRDALPTIILFVVLLLLPHAKLRTGGSMRSREVVPPASIRGVLTMAATTTLAIAAMVTLLPETSGRTVLDIGNAATAAIVILSLVPLTGFAGQISLAQVSFAGIGATIMAKGPWQGSPAQFLLVVAVCALVGAFVALPALRLQGIYLGLGTLAFAVLMERLIFPQPWMLDRGGTASPRIWGGPGGLLEDDGRYAVFIAACFGALALGVVLLRRGPFGRRLQAMKDSPAACATLGLDLTRTKLQAFMLSAGIAGIGGALFSGLSPTVLPDDFTMLGGLIYVVLAVVGGITAVGGALAGGILFGFFLIGSRLFGDWPIVPELLLLGPAFMGIALGRHPNGVVSQIRDLLDRTKRESHSGGPLDQPEELGISAPFTAEVGAALDSALDIREEDINVAARA